MQSPCTKAFNYRCAKSTSLATISNSNGHHFWLNICFILIAFNFSVDLSQAQDSTSPSLIPYKITFDPPAPSVGPGDQITITATLVDKNGKEIPNGKVQWTPSKESEDFIAINKKTDTTITIVGLNPSAGAQVPNSNLASVVATSPNTEVTSVINILLRSVSGRPGRIPTDRPEVDIMWMVLPDGVVRDNFGRRIAKKFYGIEVVIGNNSGFDLQIASLGFNLAADQGLSNIVPANGYRIARGSLEKGQQVSPRNLSLNLIRAAGPLLTGFSPFFKNLNHANNFKTGLNIFSNPLEKGFDLVIPDQDLRNLSRLDEQILRDGLIIKNNSQVRAVAFFPKGFLNIQDDELKDDQINDAFIDSLLRQKTRNGKPYELTEAKVIAAKFVKQKDLRNNPEYVMTRLGRLSLIGDLIEHVNRITFDSTGAGGTLTAPPVVTGSSPGFLIRGQEEDQEITIFGSSLGAGSISSPLNSSGIRVISSTPDPSGSAISARVKIDAAVPLNVYSFMVRTPQGVQPVSIRIEQAPPITEGSQFLASEGAQIAKVKPNQPQAQTIQVRILGKHLSEAKLSPKGKAVTDGLTVVLAESFNDTEIKAQVTVPANLPAQTYEFELSNQSPDQENKKIIELVVADP